MGYLRWTPFPREPGLRLLCLVKSDKFCEQMSGPALDFVEDLLSRGRRTFTREEAEAALGTSRDAVYLALWRLTKRRLLAMPRRGFYLIVEPAHRALGAPPPAVWIDDLMRFHGVPYYVGLLSAAALHGAAHQQPQEFQVVAGTVLRPLTVGRVRIRFFFRRHMDRVATEQVKTPSGPIPVSTPEMTAYDLVRYRKGAGSMDHVATVLAELAARMDATRLVAVAQAGGEVPVVQRLGYLLEQVGRADLAVPLAEFVREQGPRYVALEPASTDEVTATDARWRVRVNSAVEAEA